MLIDRLSQLLSQTDGAAVPGHTSLPENFLTQSISAQDNIAEIQRGYTPGYVHVSSMIAMCPRRMAIMWGENRPVIRGVTGGHRVMWKLGRAVEAHIRDQYIQNVRYHNVHGAWECTCHQPTRIEGFHRNDVTCSNCGGPLNTYAERPLFDHDLGIVGNPDMIVYHNEAFVVLEIKSMNPEQWDALSGPLGDHVFQAGMYYDLLLKEGKRAHQQVVFIYCTKKFKYGSPYKEYHVDVSAPHLRAIRDAAKAHVQQLRESQESNTLPPRVLCTTPSSTCARDCPAVSACFNRS